MDSKHTTSLELSKRLKDLGFPQRSEFYWMKPKSPMDDGDPKLYQENGYFLGRLEDIGSVWCEEYFPAYLATELGEWLPMPIDRGSSGVHRLWINREPVNDKIEIIYVNAINSSDYYLTVAGTMCDAMAHMLIYLAEQKIINPKELK